MLTTAAETSSEKDKECCKYKQKRGDFVRGAIKKDLWFVVFP
jgi:hypothetical protein